MTENQKRRLKPLLKKLMMEVKSELREEQKDKYSIEAYGVMGMKSKSWRKVFKDYDQLSTWADRMNAEVIGTRTLKNGQPIIAGDHDPFMTND